MHKYHRSFTTRKLINTNGYTEGIFPSEIYQRIYSLNIYLENYNEKENN